MVRVSPLQPTKGSGGASGAPEWGPGQSPGRKRILAYFEGHRTLLFVSVWQKYEGDNLHIASPLYSSIQVFYTVSKNVNKLPNTLRFLFQYDLERTARQHQRYGSVNLLFQTLSGDSSFLLLLAYQRIRGFAFMRYINPRLTVTSLTLTYDSVYWHIIVCNIVQTSQLHFFWPITPTAQMWLVNPTDYKL